MNLSLRAALTMAIVGCVGAISAAIPATAQRLAANHQQAERGGTMQSAPMRVAPRAAPQAPRYFAPRYFAPRYLPPRAVAPRVRLRRADAPRVYAPRARAPVSASPAEVRHPVAQPAALSSGAVQSFAAGVPVPQLRRGTPAAKFTHLPPPNFPGPQGTVHRGGAGTAMKPGHGPVAGFVKIHRRNVSIIRGARFVRRNGRWRRVVPVTVLVAPAAILVVGGASYFADGYVDLAGPTCAGVTDNGCQLSLANVPTNDGDTVPQCVQYCAWDNASAAAAPVAEPAAPEDTATTAPTAPSAPAVAPPAPEPVTLAVTPEAPVNYAQTYAINIQGAPESGGKCVGVPSRPIAQGMALQLGPCGGVSAQTFSYDSVNKRLAIGGLCVDTADGTAKAGDPLRLAPCNGRPSQTWYIRQNAAYVEFVGINGLCIDTPNTTAPDPKPLIAATCHGQASQSWTMHAAVQAAAK